MYYDRGRGVGRIGRQRQNCLVNIEPPCYPALMNDTALPSPHKPKNKPGGQRGNQNARKHGFYSRSLSPADVSEFWNIISTEGLDPEIALIRLRLQSLLRDTPSSPRLFEEASRLLVRHFRSKHGLNRSEAGYLKSFIDSIFETILVLRPAPPALSVAEGSAVEGPVLSKVEESEAEGLGRTNGSEKNDSSVL